MSETIAKDEHLIVEACSWPEFARLAQERIDEQAAEIKLLRAALAEAAKVCGRNHMNCPGAVRVKAAVEACG